MIQHATTDYPNKITY